MWSRSYRHFPDADAGGYADVLSLSAVDSLICTGGLRAPSLRLVRSGASVADADYIRAQTTGGVRVNDAIDARGVMRSFASGATVVLQALHRLVPSVQAFCEELEDFFGHPLQANAYLTPEHARGLGVHHDTHDVLVLQLFGTKHWQLYPQAVVHAVDGYPASKRYPELTSPDVSLTLSPGDCLYLPRGLPHDAHSTDGASLHLTLGIRSPTWLDILKPALEQLHEIPDLRASLPLRRAPGAGAELTELARKLRQALDQAAGWLQNLDAQALAQAQLTRQRASRRSACGALAQLATLAPIDARTAFVRNRPQHWALHGDAAHTLLLAGHTGLQFPAHIRPALEHLLGLHPVTAEGLADHLDGAGALVLVKRLYREGLLVRHHG